MCLIHSSQFGFCCCWVRLSQLLNSSLLPVSKNTMQPIGVKRSLAENVKLISNVLPLPSSFFFFFLLLKLCLKLQVLEGSHGGEAACPLNAEHLHSGDMMHILYSQLYLQVTGLARLQGVKLCWRRAHRWSSNGKSS